MSKTSKNNNIDATAVALAHDAMAEEYDEMNDLWYPWLYGQIHEFIALNIQRKKYLNRQPKALDVGCGTGLQSFLLARAGFDVLGIDIAEELINVAQSKINSHAVPPLNAPPLFPSNSWDRLWSHHKHLSNILEECRNHRVVRLPAFIKADVKEYAWGSNSYDVIACCGSVLSFIEDYTKAIEKMVMALRPGGFLFLEVEQKRNIDLFWPVIDNIIGGKLDYEQTWSTIFQNLFSKRGQSVHIDYPFELTNGNLINLPIILFSVNELNGLFKKFHLKIIDKMGIHWATNVIPSTILHEMSKNSPLKKIIRVLMFIDGKFGRLWPMWRSGCSVIYCLSKL